MEHVTEWEGVPGRMIANGSFVQDAAQTSVDAEQLRWPTNVHDATFSMFLDKLGVMFSARPSAADATVDLDKIQIENDDSFIKKYLNVKDGLRDLVAIRHGETIHSRLNGASVQGFEGYSRYQELRSLAEHGAQPYLREDFQFNCGFGDFIRPQARVLRAAIRHQYGKLHRKGWCIIVSKTLVEGMPGFHVSPTHVACKRGDTKGRCCVDENASGLNAATDMDAIEGLLGEMSLPGLRELSTLLQRAWARGAREVFKTDVSSAFNRIMLSFEAVISQATQIDNLIVFPLVAVFGWTASPIYYSLAADAVHWAHNGGVPGTVLDSWRRQQGKVVRPRLHGEPTTGRSITYVDDTIGAIMPGDEGVTIDDADTIICKLHAADGVNTDKNEQGSQLTGLGWHIDMRAGTIRPSDRGIQKMMWWCFRKIGEDTTALLLHDLQSVVSLLRWYSIAIPLAFGALQGLSALLAKAQRTRQRSLWVHLDGAACKDLEFWRWLLNMGLEQPQLWSSPLWFLAGDLTDRQTVELFTDACTSIGGGYVMGTHSFGQFRWSEQEQRFFATAKGRNTDINIMEFVVAVLAIVVEREYLNGKVVLLRVDNTSAVAWLNRHRLNHMWGQGWMRLLTIVSLKYNIRVVCKHVVGEENVIADGLSRYTQETNLSLLQNGFVARPVPSWQWRERWWTHCGETASSEEWRRALNEPMVQLSSHSLSTQPQWGGRSLTWEER